MKMHYYLLVWLSTGMLSVHAQPPVQTNAALESVTVYSAGAEMNHKARISLPAGSSEIVINNVAETLDEQSIRIGSNANITIQSVRFTRNYLKETTKSPAYAHVADSQKVVMRLLDKLANERKTEQKVLDLLDKNTSLGGSQTGVSVADLMKMAEYYKAKQLEAQNNITDLNEKISLQNATAERLRQQLVELSAGPEEAGGQLVIQVMANTAAASDFNVSYITPDAGWSAFYDLRAASTADPLKIYYKANVVQNTGIDWKKVKLKLSTGNPSKNSTAPIVTAWMLYFGQPQQYYSNNYIEKRAITNPVKALDGAPGIQMTSGGGQPGDDPDILMRGQGSLAASDAPLLVVDGVVYTGSYSSIDPLSVASMSLLKDAAASSLYGARGTKGVILITTKNKDLSNFTTTTDNMLYTAFDIDIPCDIASNDKPHSVSLKEYALPVQYKYYAVPRADQDAFLMARIGGYEKLNLLPGEANIVFEDMYVGKSFINPGITADTLSLSMGRDKKINIKREKIAELSSSKFIGSNRKQTFTYEIQLRNVKQETVALTLKDQYPLTTDKDIEIELLESGAAAVNKETGILTWDLTLKPGETRKIRISYSIKYPKDKSLANL